MKARDVMSTQLLFVGPETPVSDVAALLLEHRISGIPVVDSAGTLVGVVSEADLLWRGEIDVARRHGWWALLLGGRQMLAADFMKSYGTRARDVMTSPVVTVDADDDLSTVVAAMERHHIKRVPVMEGGRLVGIVSRSDFLRALARHRVEPTAGDDASIRAQLVELLERQPWTNLGTLNVTVENRRVRYSGLVGSETERRALGVAALGIPGVAGVEADVTVRGTTVPD